MFTKNLYSLTLLYTTVRLRNFRDEPIMSLWNANVYIAVTTFAGDENVKRHQRRRSALRSISDLYQQGSDKEENLHFQKKPIWTVADAKSCLHRIVAKIRRMQILT